MLKRKHSSTNAPSSQTRLTDSSDDDPFETEEQREMKLIEERRRKRAMIMEKYSKSGTVSPVGSQAGILCSILFSLQRY